MNKETPKERKGKLDYVKSGKLARRREQRRVEALARNEAYEKLSLKEKLKRNPKKASLLALKKAEKNKKKEAVKEAA